MAIDTSTSFGYWLRRRRKALDLTQQQLAEQVGCAAVTIQRIEQGTLRPSRQVVERLAAILELPLRSASASSAWRALTRRRMYPSRTSGPKM